LAFVYEMNMDQINVSITSTAEQMVGNTNVNGFLLTIIID